MEPAVVAAIISVTGVVISSLGALIASRIAERRSAEFGTELKKLHSILTPKAASRMRDGTTSTRLGSGSILS
jgi:hypothetical protein